MVWDLRGALLKKEERESARLADFEFRHRARTLRLVAQAMALDEAEVASKVATMKPGGLLDWLGEQHEGGPDGLQALLDQCSAEARRQLIKELGAEVAGFSFLINLGFLPGERIIKEEFGLTPDFLIKY